MELLPWGLMSHGCWTQLSSDVLEGVKLLRIHLRPRPNAQAEFEPTGVVKLHGGLEETCWRYLMTWKRTAVGPVWVGSNLSSHTIISGSYTCIAVLTSE